MKPERPTYSPRGVESDKPIGLRLSREHLEQVKRLAQIQNRSLANMARVLCIEGLKVIEQQSNSATS
jgi:hypothetical protein